MTAVRTARPPAVPVPAPRPEQTRARYPDATGVVDSGGVPVAWESYGSGEPTFLLVPTWSIVHARVWKLQVAYLARLGRVVTFDPRGNGRSGRPTDVASYAETAFAGDIGAVMDATGVDRAILVCLSSGARRSLLFAVEHPERVTGLVVIGPALALAPPLPEREVVARFEEPLDTDEGWAKDNLHYWRRDFRGFLEFFFDRCFTEAHSTKPIEDCVEWGEEIGPEALALASVADGIGPRERVLELCARIRCPVLVVHGDEDALIPHAVGVELARATGGRLVTVEGGGHIPNVRDPVLVNLLIRDFARSLAGAPRRARQTA